MQNYDQHEIAKFSEMSKTWWDPNGSFKLIHKLNPLRTDFAIDQFVNLSKTNSIVGCKILDLGCGAGILSEALAHAGAIVTGVDMSADALEAGRLHWEQNPANRNLSLTYLHQTVEQLATQQPESFDLIVCMEMVEHVPNYQSILDACAQLLKPNGVLVMSTINRTLAAKLQIIIAVEYLFKWLPHGTHEYHKFITPWELRVAGEKAGLTLKNLTGYKYNPLTDCFKLSDKVDVNYFATFQK